MMLRITHHSKPQLQLLSSSSTYSLKSNLYQNPVRILHSTFTPCVSISDSDEHAVFPGLTDSGQCQPGRPEFLLLLNSIAFIVVVVSLTESEILLQFKAGVTDDPFRKLTTWVSNKDTCRDFEGVYCNSAGSVDRIVLWNASLGGVLSPSLSKLRSLRVLTLFGNWFTGNIPQEYVEIQTLWKINVSSNLLSGYVPEFLGSLPNIRFLDLSRNSYNGEIPSLLFNRCEKAKFISLSHNVLSGAIPESISKCSSLEGFDFSFNSLSGALHEKLCGISMLKYLSVRNNVMSGRVDDRLTGCTSLELLDLGSNSTY